MATMTVARFPAANAALELVTREVPEPGAGQVLLRVRACGICHSDQFVQGGAFPGLKLPRVPGHEGAAVVERVGPGVRPWQPGDRVGVGWHGGHCFVCDSCRVGDFVTCREEQITGFAYDGGYGEYMVARAEALARIPDALGDVEAAPLLCAGITTFNALRHSVAKPGDLVAVQGLGGLGHLGIQFANRFGFRTVAVSRGKDKERLARELGADEYIDTEASDPAQELLRLGGARVVLTTAPSGRAIASLIGGIGINGQLLVVAAPPDSTELYLASLIGGARSIQGWASGTAVDSEDTLNFSILRHVLPLIETFPLERANEAYDRMMSNQVRFRAVLTLQ